MGYCASGHGEVRFDSKEKLEQAIEGLNVLPAVSSSSVVDSYPDDMSRDFCRAAIRAGFFATPLHDEFHPYAFALEHEWGKIGSWSDKPLAAIGKSCVKSYFIWEGEDGESWLAPEIDSAKDMLVAEFPNGSVDCSNMVTFINLSSGGKRYQLAVIVNDYGVPTASVSSL